MKEGLFSVLGGLRETDDSSAMTADRLRFVYRRTCLGSATTIAVAALTGLYLWHSSSTLMPLIWAAYCVLVGVGQIVAYLVYRGADDVDSNPDTWLTIAIVMAALAGVGWGAAAFLFYSLSPPDSALIITAVVAAITVFSSLLLAAFAALTLAFALPALLPLLWVVVANGATVGWFLLPILALILCAVIWHALHVRQNVAELLGMGRDNTQLIEGMERSKQEVEKLKNELGLQGDHRAEVESELRQAKLAAEAAVMAKDEFLATMSHEIRTPLNGILPILDILRSTQLDHNQHDYLNTAFQSSKHLLAIIDDILDYSKIEAGKLQLETVGINLRELLDSVTRLMSGSAAKKGLQLKTHIEPDVRVAMRGDPVRLRQVLTNLVSNAIKFTDSGSVLVSIAKRAETHSQAELLFSVKDTGIGMDRDTAERLFKPFSQADASTTRTYGGSGLGLVICKRLVEMMSGRIGVKSEPRRGSVFWFTAQMKKSLGDIQASKRGVSGSQVLLVCPDERMRQRLKVFLESWSARLTEVASLKEAVAKIRATASMGESWQFDAVILDLESCGARALELTVKIRKDPRLSRIAVLLFNADGQTPSMVAELPDVKTITAAAAEGVVHGALEDLLAGSDEEESEEADENAAAAPAAGPVRGTALLVEDNPVNLHVAQKLLGVIGLKYDVANNGKEGLHMMKQRRYDVVLMDCMMPVMDGYTATREWRKHEGDQTANARLPILAMTANAMAGDRQKCLDSGMDDYMSKPLNKQLLQQMLYRWTKSDESSSMVQDPPPKMAAPAAAPQQNSPLVAAVAAGSGVIDKKVVEDLVDVMGDDVKDLIGVYLEDAPKVLSRLAQAAEQEDMQGLVEPAHSLKSTSANIGALKLSDMAETIEHDARLGTPTDAAGRVREMMNLYKKVATELEHLRTV